MLRRCGIISTDSLLLLLSNDQTTLAWYTWPLVTYSNAAYWFLLHYTCIHVDQNETQYTKTWIRDHITLTVLFEGFAESWHHLLFLFRHVLRISQRSSNNECDTRIRRPAFIIQTIANNYTIFTLKFQAVSVAPAICFLIAVHTICKSYNLFLDTATSGSIDFQ